MKKKIDLLGEALALAATRKSEKKFPHLLGELDRHGNTAMYYGFAPVKTLQVTKDDIAKAKPLSEQAGSPLRAAESLWTAEERIAVLRSYLDNEMHALPQPIMMYYRKPFSGMGMKRNPREAHCGLEILGTPKSIAEALVILASYAMLRDEGFENLVVEINSVGERDTMARHEKELCAYFRKHINTVPTKLRPEFKSSIFNILHCNDPECAAFRDSAPKSINFLSEASRRHFMEVLEFLDTLDIPYRINHTLLGPRSFLTHTVFEIRDISDETKPVTVAAGSRYTYLSRKLGFKKELPSVGSTIFYRKPAAETPWKQITNPKFYLIQLGPDARLKSLRVIEMLRRERISVHHALTKEKLLNQMGSAESLKVPYLLIMGQKEALENTVVVRDLNTRAQETVDLANLVGYLKKLK